MAYRFGNLPLHDLLPSIVRAEDQLARLDERVQRSPIAEGFLQRLDFGDAVSHMWIAGELVHLEDLVLHDSRMDVRAPSHELVIAHSILRSRRRIAAARPDWVLGDAGIATLRGRSSIPSPDAHAANVAEEPESDPDSEDLIDEISADFAAIDSVLARAETTLAAHPSLASQQPSLENRNPLIYPEDVNEDELISEWRTMLEDVASFPPALAASLLWEAWDQLQPLQRQHWLGALLTSTYLRDRGKVTSHLLAFNIGLKAIARERRRSPDHVTRVHASLAALEGAAENGLRDLDRLMQAKLRFERRLRNRRASSSLPIVLELALSRPIITAAMVAKAAKVSQRGALNLITELGIREITGRGRYRAWGII